MSSPRRELAIGGVGGVPILHTPVEESPVQQVPTGPRGSVFRRLRLEKLILLFRKTGCRALGVSGMSSPRRDLAIGGVGRGPSLLNFIESTSKRLEERAPRTGILLENPLLGGGKNYALVRFGRKQSDTSLPYLYSIEG